MLYLNLGYNYIHETINSFCISHEFQSKKIDFTESALF